ncbi:VWA domain-containing protein [Starkeya koreensis]|uniref:VWA domain-containing protein n=1 Tax=Ancylobacter koreensis TaxID=266121 RepID=A0ABT0DRW2_9HYPH|nr:VWA domain-containing protein [Ancylobacter koreensis]MCK0210014.1 VWA domain-containing protein [Ancylobacter koreensis]
MAIEKRRDTAPAASGKVADFLAELEQRAPLTAERRGRLIFALDATMSRQPTWDMACGLQGEMFDEAASIGGLDIQLVYYRGIDECRASPWMADGTKLGALMARIACQGGRTQIARVLRHAEAQAGKGPVGALVFVGDALEEPIDALCAEAGPLALRGVPVFMFQEGRDPAVERGFREIARLTRGAWCRFDAGAAAELRALLRAVASYAAGGGTALAALAGTSPGARRLIAAMQDSQ